MVGSSTSASGWREQGLELIWRCRSGPAKMKDNAEGMPPPPPRFFTSVDGSVDIPDTVLISRVDKKRLTVFSDGAGGTMAEVGLLPFARVALEVATQVLPPYRTRFSKHQFTQPQLLAVLCLMRYEDWTFREAEVRLREHHELRAVLQLPAVPDYTT